MASYVGFSPKNPNRYVGPNLYLSTIVVRNRQPTGADYRLPANGKIYSIGSYWILSKDPVNGVEGEIWYLSKIVANVAYWLKLSSGGAGPIVEIDVQDAYAPGVTPVMPSVIGEFFYTASAVANASTPVRTTTRALNTMSLEVQYATSEAATDATKVGLSSYLNTQFDVDSSGFVSLKGSTGPALTKVEVDAHTGPGTNPVVPDSTGQMTVTGSSTAAGSVPVQTNSLAANTYAIQVQKSQAIASTDATKVGLAAFDSAAFDVDANGFVSLSGGGGAAIEKVNLDTGTTPITASSGTITLTAGTVAAGSNPIRTNGTDANTAKIEVQFSQAIASTDATKVGLASFSSTNFDVDASGFVSFKQLTTGGTFTPSLTFGGGSTGMTYTTQTGYYTIVGNLVFFVLNIVLSAKGSSTGSAKVINLPFAGALDRITCFLNMTVVNIPATTYIILAQVPSGSTTIDLIYGTSGSPQGGGDIDDTFFTDTGGLRISGFYFKS